MSVIVILWTIIGLLSGASLHCLAQENTYRPPVHITLVFYLACAVFAPWALWLVYKLVGAADAKV